MFFLVIALQIQPQTYTFDRIEVNHVYDERGNVRLDQIIYWDFDEQVGDWKVVTWRNITGARRELSQDERTKISQSQESWMPVNNPWIGSPMIPVRNGSWYVATWNDKQYSTEFVLAKARTKCFIVTHTQYDREIKNREKYPSECRPVIWGKRQ